MDLAQSLAVYALTLRELGLPLRFPGALGATSTFVNCTHGELLAEATAWAGGAPEARDATFNVVDGDLFRWPQLFESVAGYFAMDVRDPQPMALAEELPPLAPVWGRLAAREGLVEPDVTRIASWGFCDFLFAVETDGVLDTIALRQAGFGAFRRTEDALVSVFDRLRTDEVIPRS